MAALDSCPGSLRPRGCCPAIQAVTTAGRRTMRCSAHDGRGAGSPSLSKLLRAVPCASGWACVAVTGGGASMYTPLVLKMPSSAMQAR